MATGTTNQQNIQQTQQSKDKKSPSGAPLRTRKSNGKSRGGCLVCKKRRIKVCPLARCLGGLDVVDIVGGGLDVHVERVASNPAVAYPPSHHDRGTAIVGTKATIWLTESLV